MIPKLLLHEFTLQGENEIREYSKLCFQNGSKTHFGVLEGIIFLKRFIVSIIIFNMTKNKGVGATFIFESCFKNLSYSEAPKMKMELFI